MRVHRRRPGGMVLGLLGAADVTAVLRQVDFSVSARERIRRAHSSDPMKTTTRQTIGSGYRVPPRSCVSPGVLHDRGYRWRRTGPARNGGGEMRVLSRRWVIGIWTGPARGWSGGVGTPGLRGCVSAVWATRRS